MNLLAFDTSTEALSIALQKEDGGTLTQWDYTGAGGAQASTDLIPKCLEFLGNASLKISSLEAICFGAGPGSFTGLRTSCAVAQGFAFGANVAVLAVDSLLAVAEEARHQSPGSFEKARVLALLDARMDEMYGAVYEFNDERWQEIHPPCLVSPEELAGSVLMEALSQGKSLIAGNVGDVYANRLGQVEVIKALPNAQAMLRLAPQMLREGKAVSAKDALPRYVRDKVAQTTAERVAAKQNQEQNQNQNQKQESAALQVRFEALRDEDLDKVVQIEDRVYAHPWSRTNFSDALKSGYQAQALMAGHTMLAYFVAMKGVDEVHLLNLAVAPEYQRQGWARLMLDALATWSRGQAAEQLWLEVRAGNVRAQKIYERHGYARIGVRKGYYPDGTEREDAVVMSLKL